MGFSLARKGDSLVLLHFYFQCKCKKIIQSCWAEVKEVINEAKNLVIEYTVSENNSACRNDGVK